MMKMTLLSAILLGLLAACGSTSRTPHADGKGGEPSAGGAATSTDPCAGLVKRLGARYDEAGACVDTADLVEVGCNGESLMGGYYCVERRADRAKFWVISVDALVVNESEWAFCSSDRATLPPTPCFAAMCDAAPVTLCTKTQTIANYGCGSRESEWDENCCRRRDCSSSAECQDGEECVAVRTRTFWDCWPTHEDTCDCGGTLGGRDRTVCVPP